ncbi:hypothetical protein ABT001_34550 [Streptomyces sp. NPDC002793]|uniref:hypothetical protein n=1 Tax=Streptomyces sp. NPDC002793 TaxID=3154432 RepID=UPI00331C7892
MPEKPAPALRYAEQLTYENVRDLETFCYQQLERLHEQVGETGELSFALEALSIYVSTSAGMLEHLLKTDPAVRTDWHRWWTHLEHHDAAGEADFRAGIVTVAEEAGRS